MRSAKRTDPPAGQELQLSGWVRYNSGVANIGIAAFLGLKKKVVMSTRTEATIEDLYRVHGKAEIVNGEIVLMSATGDLPNTAAGEIFASLREYARRTKLGRAYTDNAAFIVDLPNRKSFSPDAAFYIGPRAGGKFLDGAPLFAVEVRREGDYGPSAEEKMARKRADYFAAGTLAVWDVDVLRHRAIRCYRSDDPNDLRMFHSGEIADAEPALPGWSMPVDDLFT
jgi:Uma2 family endonuclease